MKFKLTERLLAGLDLARFVRGTDPATGRYGYYNVDEAEAIAIDRYRKRFGIPSVFAP